MTFVALEVTPTLYFMQVPVPPDRPHHTYQQKVDQALNNLKTRSTLEEENVAAVLRDKGKLHKQFPEAEHLLGRVSVHFWLCSC